ncbi:MAG: TetR family transcriptional regulator [Burkholderiales bacterium]
MATGPTASARSATTPDTREKLKEVAQRLFAERGIDGVAVRDIVASSGQRNAASIHYYFGGKDALVRELLEDGARRIDLRRNALLDELEAQGLPLDLRQMVELLVRSSIPDANEGGTATTYLRFIAMLQVNHRDLFLQAIEGRWDSGYKRLLAHLRRLLNDRPESLVSQRLVFMGLYVGHAMAVWEASWGNGRTDSFWHRPVIFHDLVDTATALLLAPSSEASHAAMEAHGRTAAVPRKRHR